MPREPAMWAVTVRTMTLTSVLPMLLSACTSGRHAGLTSSTVLAASATLPDQVTVTMASFAPGADDLGAWLTIKVRVDNHSAHSRHMPAIGIVCTEDATVGLHRVVPSTLSLTGSVPAGASRVGTLMLLLPGDRRLGTGVAACRGPAVVQASELTNTRAVAPAVRFTVPDEVLATLNATRNK
jgi:hypothetical protein